jgi:serine/threonine-protein kinase
MPKDASKREAITVVDHGRARVSPVTPMELPSGRFHDEGEIAQGGASAVHRIFDKTLLRRCAMKVMATELQPYPEDRQRFIEEAQITGQLDHPNVVPIYELSLNSSGVPYFTMKLVEGQTLDAMLAARQGEVRQLDWVAPFLDILVKVCDAIAFAHSRGVIHRDLKPANIMVGDFGQLYVMDWGIARLVVGHHEVAVGRDHDRQSLDKEGIVLGTPAYMPPEQALGHHDTTDERSDIFSLGATLYEILTGQPPYADAKGRDQLTAAQAGAIVPPEQFVTAGRLPRGLCRIAMKAMAYDPAARYATATALKEDLVAQLRADLPRRTFAAGELVMREGDPGDSAYIILHGTCRAFKLVDGEEIELRRMGPGEVFGETAILSAKPRSASVQALTPLTVQVVTPEELEEGVGMNTWLGLFVRTLAERFREVDERLTKLESSLHRDY